jgi:hypothetical protein
MSNSKLHKELPDVDFILTVGQHDPAHCLAPRLFRCYAPDEYIIRTRDGETLYERYAVKEGENEGQFKLKGGERIPLRRRPSYVEEYTYNGQILKFFVAEGLGADDLRVLQGLVAMAGATKPKIITLSVQPLSIHGQALREALKVDSIPDESEIEDSEAHCIVVRDSFYRLAKEIGYKDPGGGSSSRQIQECIGRLYNVSIVVTNEKTGYSEGFRLLSRYKATTKEKEESPGSASLLVALNPRIATAIMSGVNSGYTRIDMADVRRIRSDGTRLIHQRLCGWIDPGCTHKVSNETLCTYIWPSPALRSSSTYRTRIQSVRRYLQELVDIGWSVKPYRKGHVEIFRPSEPVRS